MTITDKQRNDLYRACEETMGEGPAETLLSLLPPVGWAAVATKQDLEHLATKADLQSVRTDQQSLRADIERSLREQTRTMLFGLASINLTFLGAVLVGARLVGG